MDHIFTIWLTDKDWDGMPYLYELCIASMQVYSGKPVTIYTNHKLHLSFLDRKITNIAFVPIDYMTEAMAIDLNSKAHQSDYIRLKLLEEKGGIYFDTDILFWDSPIHIWNKLMDSDKKVLYCMEDKYMITNCFIMTKKDSKTLFFENMFEEYNNRFIEHSYLHNSQKFLDLMRRRYKNDLYIYDEPSLFGVTWNFKNCEILYNEPLQPVIGQHLFSSNREWDEHRKWLDENCYDIEPSTFIASVTKEVIDKYIDLMKEEDLSDNTK